MKRCPECNGLGLHVGKIFAYTKPDKNGYSWLLIASSTAPDPEWPAFWLRVRRKRKRK